MLSNIEEELEKLRAENFLFLKGEKIFLFSGEIHFWRIDPQYWEKCLCKLREAGLKIVSTYVSWCRHNISPIENDLIGKTDPQLNLRRFLQLCAKLEIWVHLKPGPWICAEELNGGYPEWLLQKKEILVRDNKESLVKGYNSPFSHYIPSYLHPEYLKYVKKWLTDVDVCIKDFCYPKGPIILIQLDNEPSMTFHDKAFESDYNSVNVKGFGVYQRWLKEKYSSIELLNLAHDTSYASFFDVKAPVALNIMRFCDLRKYTDWAEFKEWFIARHIKILREIHSQNGVKDVLFTVNFNEHHPMAVPNNWNKLEQAACGIGGYDYYNIPPFRYKNFIDFIKAINYSLATLKIPWSPEMMCGIWKFDGGEEICKDKDLLSAQMNSMYLLSIAYGLKGMNFYMFVNRENWEHAPVDEKGRPTKMYSILNRVMDFVRSVRDFPSLKKSQKIAVMYYRPYAWEAYIALDEKIKVNDLHLGRSYHLFKTLYTALVNLNYDPAIFDPFVNNEMDISKYKLIFVPSSSYMDENTQKLLKKYIESGGIVVFFPKLPTLDLDFRPCSYFSKYVKYTKLKIHRKLSVKEITVGKGKVLIMKKNYFYNNNIKRNKPSLDVLSSFLEYHGLRPEVETNNRYILTVVQKNKFEKILFVINMNSKFKEVKLKFQKPETGKLEEFFSQKTASYIKRGEATIDINGLEVEIFRILV